MAGAFTQLRDTAAQPNDLHTEHDDHGREQSKHSSDYDHRDLLMLDPDLLARLRPVRSLLAWMAARR